MKKIIAEITSKELNRREFLKLVAGLLLLTIGVQGFLQHILHFKQPTASNPAPTRHGFGASKFGR